MEPGGNYVISNLISERKFPPEIEPYFPSNIQPRKGCIFHAIHPMKAGMSLQIEQISHEENPVQHYPILFTFSP